MKEFIKVNPYLVKHKKHFTFCDEILSLALQALPEIQRPSKTYGEVITAFLIKAINSFRSVIVLCREGLGDDAGLIVRSLLNLGYLVKWVEEDKESRAKRFFGWFWKEKIELANSLEDTPTKEEEEEWAKAKNLFEYSVKEGESKFVRNWYGNETIRDLAASLKESISPPDGYRSYAEYHYEDGYKILSKIEHSNPLASMHFLQRTKGHYLASYLSQDELIHLDLKNAFQYFYLIFSTWNSHFQMVSPDNLKELFEKGKNHFKDWEAEK